MSYVDVLRDEIVVHLDDAERRVRDAIRTLPAQLRAAVKKAADDAFGGAGRYLIPDDVVKWIADQVVAAALEALEECLKHIEVYREAAAFLGSPDQLRAAAEMFGTIGDHAAALQIRKDDLEGYLMWDDGMPTKRYEAAIEDQITALARVQPAASSVKDVLRQHADDIENYYPQLLGLVAGLAVAILGVVAAIVSLVAAVLLIETVVGTVVAAIGAALSLVVALGGLAVSGISAVQFLVTSIQGAANKLDAMPSSMVEWKKPSFAEIK
ncbi:MAG: hypothetical protein JST33_16930 [Actinobacteria bacterium]|nr:hypothetical protein [Actinomycetota bacterium]